MNIDLIKYQTDCWHYVKLVICKCSFAYDMLMSHVIKTVLKSFFSCICTLSRFSFSSRCGTSTGVRLCFFVLWLQCLVPPLRSPNCCWLWEMCLGSFVSQLASWCSLCCSWRVTKNTWRTRFTFMCSAWGSRGTELHHAAREKSTIWTSGLQCCECAHIDSCRFLPVGSFSVYVL